MGEVLTMEWGAFFWFVTIIVIVIGAAKVIEKYADTSIKNTELENYKHDVESHLKRKKRKLNTHLDDLDNRINELEEIIKDQNYNMRILDTLTRHAFTKEAKREADVISNKIIKLKKELAPLLIEKEKILSHINTIDETMKI